MQLPRPPPAHDRRPRQDVGSDGRRAAASTVRASGVDRCDEDAVTVESRAERCSSRPNVRIKRPAATTSVRDSAICTTIRAARQSPAPLRASDPAGPRNAETGRTLGGPERGCHAEENGRGRESSTPVKPEHAPVWREVEEQLQCRVSTTARRAAASPEPPTGARLWLPPCQQRRSRA